MSNYRSEKEIIADLRREVRGAQLAVATLDEAIADRLGVNATDYRCLDIVDQRGPITASALADALGLGRSATTTVIDRLEKLRYVRRRPGTDDRRQVLVELMPHLRRRAREVFGDEAEVVRKLRSYTRKELELLIGFVRWDRELNEGRAARLARAGYVSRAGRASR